MHTAFIKFVQGVSRKGRLHVLHLTALVPAMSACLSSPSFARTSLKMLPSTRYVCHFPCHGGTSSLLIQSTNLAHVSVNNVPKYTLCYQHRAALHHPWSSPLGIRGEAPLRARPYLEFWRKALDARVFLNILSGHTSKTDYV
jgi:hypothetical protein